ncbi:MAG: Ig-like domain-containing protein [Spirochaetaceae bacterium]|jgi:hypothetical protein|nr:Ig-like domain-containing protein [Spirochaetaceae bacterium]
MYKKMIYMNTAYFACLFILILPVFCGGCDLLRDEAFEVSGWSPGEGVHGADAPISLSFTGTPDRLSVERSFSLNSDDGGIRGAFAWEGSTLRFLPAAPLENGQNYRISVSTNAKDKDNVSLEKKFEGAWTTRPGEERPRFLGSVPEDGGRTAGALSPVEIMFSAAPSALACKNGITINPAVAGHWSVLENKASFTPAENWQKGQTYKVTIAKDIAAPNGKTLGYECHFSFYVNTDATPPRITGVYALDTQGAKAYKLSRCQTENKNPENPVLENENWESNYSLRFEFSEKIELARFKSHITIEPQVRYAIAENALFSNFFTLTFLEKPKYGARYACTINEGLRDASGNQDKEVYLYRIYVNGVHSKPPRFAGFRMPETPLSGGADTTILAYIANDLQNPGEQKSYPYNFNISGEDGKYKFTSQCDTWIELYFDTADGADIDLISVRELFRLDCTNNCITFSPQSVRASAFTWADKADMLINYQRVEVKGKLQNINRQGLVTFYIGAGLRDSLGNINDNIQRIELYK